MLNHDTRVFLQEIFDTGFRYLARDAYDNTLYAYRHEPVKKENIFRCRKDGPFEYRSLDMASNLNFILDHDLDLSIEPLALKQIDVPDLTFQNSPQTLRGLLTESPNETIQKEQVRTEIRYLISIRIEGQSPDCTWAEFILDPKEKRMSVHSDALDSSHQWHLPVHEDAQLDQDAFLSFLLRVDRERFLDVMAERSAFDQKATIEKLKKIQSGCPTLQQAPVCHSPAAFADWYLEQEDTHPDDLECIVTDYPAPAKALSDLFEICKYQIQKLITEKKERIV